VSRSRGAPGLSGGERRIGALLLDFGGTLDSDGVHWGPRLHAAYTDAGGTLPLDSFEAIFREALRGATDGGHFRRAGFRETVERLSQRIHSLIPDRDRVDAQAMESRFYADASATVSRNRPVLERLARTNRIVAISNFTGNLEPCMEELGIRTYFDAVVDSGCFGVSKPDARIFEEGLRRLGAAASATWMVGDNPGADILPALALGMKTCWVAPPDRSFPGENGPTARIARFPDLVQVLEGVFRD